MRKSLLTEDDEHAHPGRARELALRIPELNNHSERTYLRNGSEWVLPG